jgi:hypothetical protein
MIVMAGLVPAIHAFHALRHSRSTAYRPPPTAFSTTKPPMIATFFENWMLCACRAGP